ncbi:predicted protein [Burkholderiales bacterium GJ-E10]|nr:predicted protein [Burkholderiales bacterium GJ-E10]
MSELAQTQIEALRAPRHQWRPLYWEPVSGSGERLMVGVVHAYDERPGAVRTIREDVLDSLYGQQATGARTLLDTALRIFAETARASPLDALNAPILGVHPGELRTTAARNLGELLHTAVLLYSSVANLDELDEEREEGAPQQEEVNKRFATEVREIVVRQRPDLAPGFSRGGVLVPGGQMVRFGYFSARGVAHFTVLSPVRQWASMRDARARLFELQRAQHVSKVERAILIGAVPRDDDPVLGEKQRKALRTNRAEIETEAAAVNATWFAVNSADEGAERLIQAVG